MSDYVLFGEIIILCILFAIHMLLNNVLIKSSDECIKACKDYIEVLEKSNEILRDERKDLVAVDRILEIISDVRQDANNGYMFDMVDEIEKRVKGVI